MQNKIHPEVLPAEITTQEQKGRASLTIPQRVQTQEAGQENAQDHGCCEISAQSVGEEDNKVID